RAERVDQALPVPVVVNLDGAPGVLAGTGKDTARRCTRTAVSIRLRQRAGGGASQNGGAEHIHRRLDLRELDLLPFASARAMKGRGQNRDQRMTGIGNVVGIMGS